MVGQSFDVAVLALIDAPSTAEVTALICSGDPLAGLCASAALQDSVRPSPIAIAACARRADRREVTAISGNKRQAESTRGERVILSPPKDFYRNLRQAMHVVRIPSIDAVRYMEK